MEFNLTEKFYISITTLPSRVNCFLKAAESICLQDTSFPFIFIINLDPDYDFQFPVKKLIQLLDENKSIKGKYRINICEKKYGPGAKLIGLFEKKELNPNAFIITVDDDIYYHPLIAHRLFSSAVKHPNEAIGFCGWSGYSYIKTGKMCLNYEEHFKANSISYADILEGYRGVCYRPKFFGDYDERKLKFLDKLYPIPQNQAEYDGLFWCDDVRFSGILALNMVHRRVIRFYEYDRINTTMYHNIWSGLNEKPIDDELHLNPSFQIRNANAVAVFYNLNPSIWIQEPTGIYVKWLKRSSWMNSDMVFKHQPLKSIQKRIQLFKKVLTMNPKEDEYHQYITNLLRLFKYMVTFSDKNIDLKILHWLIKNGHNDQKFIEKILELETRPEEISNALQFYKDYHSPLVKVTSLYESIPQSGYRVQNTLLDDYFKSWKTFNPLHQYYIFNENEIDLFISTFYPSYLDLMKGYIKETFKNEILPLFIIHHCGGLYISPQTECSNSFEGMVQSICNSHSLAKGLVVLFIQKTKTPIMELSKDVMISSPHHPFWLYCFSLLAGHQRERPRFSFLKICYEKYKVLKIAEIYPVIITNGDFFHPIDIVKAPVI